MLASDVNNPEFVGAVNPDSQLYVEFYWHEPVNKWASEEATQKAGKRVVVKGERQPFVRIMRPGDQTTILETAVREDHKQRWPEKWLYWMMAEGLVDEGAGVPGWKIDEWPHLKDQPDLLRELKFLRFHTVDQVAGASDAQVQKLGIGGPGLREQAKVDLRERMGREVKDQMAQKDKEIADMKEQLAKLTALVMGDSVAEASDDEREALAKQYEEKFGKKPHHRLSVETMRSQLG